LNLREEHEMKAAGADGAAGMPWQGAGVDHEVRFPRRAHRILFRLVAEAIGTKAYSGARARSPTLTPRRDPPRFAATSPAIGLSWMALVSASVLGAQRF